MLNGRVRGGEGVSVLAPHRADDLLTDREQAAWHRDAAHRRRADPIGRRRSTLPCDPHGGQCEACLNGCQPLSYVYKAIRRSAPSVDREDALQPPRPGGKREDMYALVLQPPCGRLDWSAIAQTNIPDVVSNHNAGSLPDGRTFLLRERDGFVRRLRLQSLLSSSPAARRRVPQPGAAGWLQAS